MPASNSNYEQFLTKRSSLPGDGPAALTEAAVKYLCRSTDSEKFAELLRTNFYLPPDKVADPIDIKTVVDPVTGAQELLVKGHRQGGVVDHLSAQEVADLLERRHAT